ncbi:MAG: bacteriocin-protection protein [Ramlibacter sp.]|nr:bacteriocin-protection protein [Ramlibacter sp.]
MPTFFKTPAAFRAWLAKHAKTEQELVVGFYKRDSGRPSITWQESVDEALCVGWIDGVRKRIDEDSYQIRFSPRKRGSNWSAINIAKVESLERQGRMKATGRAAFAHRNEEKSRIYSYEQVAQAEFPAADKARFRAHKAAWKFFEAQPAGYRHQMIWRIVSAKRETTRESRLARLIEACAEGRRLQ